MSKSYPMVQATITNPLLLNDVVGEARPTCYDLPAAGFTYGATHGVDQEGAREITMHWDNGANKPRKAQVYKFNFIAFNKSNPKAKTMDLQSAKEKSLQSPAASRVYSNKNNHVLPTYPIPGFTFGKCAQKGGDTAGTVLGASQNATDQHPYQKRNVPKAQFGAIKQTTTSVKRAEIARDRKNTRAEGGAREWRMAKFSNIKGTMTLPDRKVEQMMRSAEAAAAAQAAAAQTEAPPAEVAA